LRQVRRRSGSPEYPAPLTGDIRAAGRVTVNCRTTTSRHIASAGAPGSLLTAPAPPGHHLGVDGRASPSAQPGSPSPGDRPPAREQRHDLPSQARDSRRRNQARNPPERSIHHRERFNNYFPSARHARRGTRPRPPSNHGAISAGPEPRHLRRKNLAMNCQGLGMVPLSNRTKHKSS